MNISKKHIVWGVIIIVALGIIYMIFSSISGPGEYDSFAQCLTDSGAKMYGAYWCPHCAEQKDLFGKSWKNINYIECSLSNRAGQNAECNSAGIQSYPTWELADGTRLTGVQSIERLSQLTGCSINNL